MSATEEIHMPEDASRLVQHAPVDVLLVVRSAHGDERTVLAGRTTTQHLRPNGAIVQVRPQFQLGQASPVKRGDMIRARLRRPSQPQLEADGTVSWVRPKAFLPSGLAVSLVGITFSWDAEEKVLEIAAFLA